MVSEMINKKLAPLSWLQTECAHFPQQNAICPSVDKNKGILIGWIEMHTPR